jgi:hypothetical protein
MRRKRARDRAQGIVEILVRVPADRADEVRALAERLLAQMPARTLPGQLGLELGAAPHLNNSQHRGGGGAPVSGPSAPAQ